MNNKKSVIFSILVLFIILFSGCMSEKHKDTNSPFSNDDGTYTNSDSDEDEKDKTNAYSSKLPSITNTIFPSEYVEGETYKILITIYNPKKISLNLQAMIFIENMGSIEKNFLINGKSYETVTFNIKPIRTDDVINYFLKENNKVIESGNEYIDVKYAELKIKIDDINYHWNKSIDDLPKCNANIRFKVSNIGDGFANNVSLYVNDSHVEQIPKIFANTDWSGNCDVSLTYKERENNLVCFRSVELEASNSYCNAHSTLNLRDRFNYSFYITPRNIYVESKLNEILSDKSIWDIRSEWQVIRDWVGGEISYVLDDENKDPSLTNKKIGDGHPGADYWQFPTETIASGEGDCEDQAILLASLLRAYGYNKDEVFVIIGCNPIEECHAWVGLKEDYFGYEYWIYLEPVEGGFIEQQFSGLIKSIDSLAKYFGFDISEFKELYRFNDKYIE